MRKGREKYSARLLHKATEQSGSTLIELTLSVVVLSLALLSLIAVFSGVSVSMQSGEHRRIAEMLAQEQMEEIRARRFDEKSKKDANGNWSSSFGADSGETSTDESTFDDVDDFNNWTESLSGSFNGFSRSVSVSYVNEGAPNTPVSIPSPITSNWTPDYKRIVVTCSSTVSSVTLVSLVSAAQKGG